LAFESAISRNPVFNQPIELFPRRNERIRPGVAKLPLAVD
jgi:hypothetical protein